jgi:hypothetical protein
MDLRKKQLALILHEVEHLKKVQLQISMYVCMHEYHYVCVCKKQLALILHEVEHLKKVQLFVYTYQYIYIYIYTYTHTHTYVHSSCTKSSI